MTLSNQIKFNYLYKEFVLSNRTQLKAFLILLFKREGFKVKTINYIFCSDEYLHELNKTVLKHDNYTDIITFPYSQGKEPVISDVYISIERIKENALAYSTSFKEELHRVIFHGALHLCGYKDKSPADIKLMRNKESQYLKRYFRST
jgi:rRNA maturation RNase YbeY